MFILISISCEEEALVKYFQTCVFTVSGVEGLSGVTDILISAESANSLCDHAVLNIQFYIQIYKAYFIMLFACIFLKNIYLFFHQLVWFQFN